MPDDLSITMAKRALSLRAGVSDDASFKKATAPQIRAATSVGTDTRSQASVGVGRSISTGAVINDNARSQKVVEGGNAVAAMEEVAHIRPLPHVGLACDEKECVHPASRELHKSLMRVARMDHCVIVRLCQELLVDNLAELRETEDEDVDKAFEAKDDKGKINLIFDDTKNT